MPPSVNTQLETLRANTVDFISEDELRAKLERGKPLRAKLGIDPTASDIHLGFAVVLRKLREFQDLGHTAVLILGDFTAQVGDPSGRSASRPRLSKEEVDAHAETYLEQIHQILSTDRLEVRRNAEWLGTMGIEDALRLASRTTVARMLERDDFANRYAEGSPISVMEFLYPLLQGCDSVVVEADVELGGTDQLFNFLLARQLQEQEGQEPQCIITTPLLVGLDGAQKMSKSLGNYVGISEPPAEQFGKVMSIPDDLIEQWALLTTSATESITRRLQEGTKVEAKRALGRAIVDEYHPEGSGAAAEAEFDRVFKAKETPTDIPEHVLDVSEAVDGKIRLANVLRQAGLVQSNTEGQRLITQGGVRCNDEPATDPDAALEPAELDGVVLQVGRRRWVRIRANPAR
ncbi:MAG: tyrosine--tRNA ligase [Acidimicrobiia bacterium]